MEGYKITTIGILVLEDINNNRLGDKLLLKQREFKIIGFFGEKLTAEILFQRWTKLR